MKFKVSEDIAGKRLDIAVLQAVPQLSRAFIKRLCDDGKIMVNAIEEKAGYKTKANDMVTVEYDVSELERIPDITLPVLYEDDDCVVINKPTGLLTHSKGAFNPEPTVATWLRSRIDGLSGERAGIVHRLDRATSGVMICAKNQTAMSWLQRQFSQRKVVKTYLALIAGNIEPASAIIDVPIERNPKAPATFRAGSNGKSAQTEYVITKAGNGFTLLTLTPKTGRTHQLRVHLAYLHHPIVGDTLYGGEPADRLFLHALSLELTLPNRLRKSFTAPEPMEFDVKLGVNDG